MTVATDVVEESLGYRRFLASLLPALLLAYVMLLFPAIYAKGMLSIGPSDDVPPPQDFVLNRLVFPGLFVLSTAVFFAEWPRIRLRRDAGSVLLPLSAFLVLAAGSSLWALSPALSTSHFFLFLITIGALGMACLVADSMPRIFNQAFVVVCVAVVVNLVMMPFITPTAIGYQGIYSHKNALGAVMALAVLFCVYAFCSTHRWMRVTAVPILPMALFVLVKSESKTSLGFALATPLLGGAFVLARRYLRFPVFLSILLFSGLVALTLWALTQSGVPMSQISQAMVGDPTFTGRTDLWAFAIDHIANRPWFGHGYASFWQIGPDSPQLSAPPGFVQKAPNAHNNYIELLLELGIVGLALFTMVLFGVCRQLTRLIDEQVRIGYPALVFFLFLLLHALLEAKWFEPVEANTTILFFLIFAPLADRRRTGA